MMPLFPKRRDAMAVSRNTAILYSWVAVTVVVIALDSLFAAAISRVSDFYGCSLPFNEKVCTGSVEFLIALMNIAFVGLIVLWGWSTYKLYVMWREAQPAFPGGGGAVKTGG